jgi:hypothetical protein
LEGRELEERMVTEADPYIGSKIAMDEDFAPVRSDNLLLFNNILARRKYNKHLELNHEFI